LEGNEVTLFAFAGGAIQLVPDGTLLFHLVLVVVMVALLNATLLKPINRILEERERRTKGRFSEAQEIMAQVSNKLADYESRLREARTAGYGLMEEQRSVASRERERKMAEVKTEVTTWLDAEKKALQAQQEQARLALAVEARTRASEITTHVLGRTIKP
jgi:F-type H+-transporting ATPase subunit b